MIKEDRFEEKRWIELSERAFSRGIPQHTEFLTLAEQQELARLARSLPSGYFLDGGCEGAERKIACFGEPDRFSGEASPVACLELSPVSERFAEPLAHRDCLGALMSLGIRRGLIGDILIAGSGAYVICLRSTAEYLMENLKEIRHTPVRCRLADRLPEAAFPQPEEAEVVVSSPRLDSLISAVFKLSRGESAVLIERELVLINGAAVLKADAHPEEGAIVSVRGRGRFLFAGIKSETKKGRLRAVIKLYK